MKAISKITCSAPVVVSFVCAFVFLLSGPALFAQSGSQRTPPISRTNEAISAGKNSSSDDTAPLTTFEEELRAKRAIKLAENEHQENLSRAREISQVARELGDARRKKSTLDREDLKRLDRLEKLTMKIRRVAGGEDSEATITSRPVDLSSAVSQIGEVAQSLSKNVQNTPRQVVSASVIETANVLLELIRLVRGLSR